MSRAEAHSWWDDVQHLKPQGNVRPPAGGGETLRDAAEASSERRRARVTETAEHCLSRSDAADFADAFDLDGAFGAPRRRFARSPHIQDTDEGPVIVLERDHAPAPAPQPVPAAAVEVPARDPFDELLSEPADRDPDSGRRVVRVTGHPEATVTPRRLREIEPRRQRRSVAERAVASPDRIALYVVLLGLFLVVLAAASSGPQP